MTAPDAPTHTNLVKSCVRWARDLGYDIVLHEWGKKAGEHPDVFACNSMTGDTMVIEVKVSMPDFIRDKVKKWRKLNMGMGRHRYYCFPSQLLREHNIQPPGRWGTLEWCDGQVTQSLTCEPDLTAMGPDIRYLAKALRSAIANAGDGGVRSKASTPHTDEEKLQQAKWMRDVERIVKNHPGMSAKDVLRFCEHPKFQGVAARKSLTALSRNSDFRIRVATEDGIRVFYPQ